MLFRLTRSALDTIALTTFGGVTHAQSDYPGRLIRVIVDFAVGDTMDTATRISAKLVDKLGRRVVVETKPDAGSSTAGAAAAGAEADLATGPRGDRRTRDRAHRPTLMPKHTQRRLRHAHPYRPITVASIGTPLPTASHEGVSR